MSALSATPAINVKPVIGGVEIAVRYITRANERYQLRAKLYQTQWICWEQRMRLTSALRLWQGRLNDDSFAQVNPKSAIRRKVFYHAALP